MLEKYPNLEVFDPLASSFDHNILVLGSNMVRSKIRFMYEVKW